MRCKIEVFNFFHLEFYVGVDQVIREHVTGLEEGAIAVELLERLAQ